MRWLIWSAANPSECINQSMPLTERAMLWRLVLMNDAGKIVPLRVKRTGPKNHPVWEVIDQRIASVLS